MSKPRNPPAAEAVDSEAIQRVMQAEQAAQQAVEQCERQAQATLQAAHMQVQRIAQRADERITRVEMRCAQWLSEQNRRLAITEARMVEAAAEVSDHRIDSIAEALAARLSGGAGRT